MKVFIDLFSGLGGASAAFDAAPNWCTLKLDNNPDLVDHNRGLIVCDITNVENTVAIIGAMLDGIITAHGPIEELVIWASPPCNQFSFANVRRNENEFDLSCLDAAQDIIEIFSPGTWIIENVKGAQSVFDDELTYTTKQILGAQYLWGNFPLIPIADRASFKLHKKTSAKGSRKLRPNYRALIPWEISDGLRTTLDFQQRLTDME
jgi:hypothetical protein